MAKVNSLLVVFQFAGIGLIACNIQPIPGTVIFLSALGYQFAKAFNERAKLDDQDKLRADLDTLKKEVTNLVVAAGFRGL